MKLYRTLAFAFTGIAAAIGLWSTAAATPNQGYGWHYGHHGHHGQSYRVTITNVTKGQVLAPAFVVSHDGSYHLFESGQPASSALAFQAEEGNPSMMVAAAEAHSGTFSTATGTGAIPPGQSESILIEANVRHPFISVSGMLVSTNDGFYALRDEKVPRFASRHLAEVYDAGSEVNSESCMYIPGPPCGSSMSHDPAQAEGFVRIHEGIQGIGDLDPAQFDWRSGAAEITIERL